MVRKQNVHKFGRRYPWREWFQLSEFRLVRGRDYNGRTDTMVQQVRNAAVKLSKHVSIRTAEDGQSLAVSVSDIPVGGE